MAASSGAGVHRPCAHVAALQRKDRKMNNTVTAKTFSLDAAGRPRLVCMVHSVQLRWKVTRAARNSGDSEHFKVWKQKMHLAKMTERE